MTNETLNQGKKGNTPSSFPVFRPPEGIFEEVYTKDSRLLCSFPPVKDFEHQERIYTRSKIILRKQPSRYDSCLS